MDRILIECRETDYQNFKRGLRKACAKANTLFSEIFKICDFDIPESMIDDIYTGNGLKTSAKIEEKVRRELKQAGISSDTVVKTAVNGDLEKFFILFNSKEGVDHSFLKYLKIEGKEVKVKEEELEAAKEDFSSYITTERGKEVREKQQAMITAINDFLEFVPTFNSTNFHSIIPVGYPTRKAELVNLRYDTL